jgi:hypothetical protein
MVICTIGLVSLAELMAVTMRMQQLGRNNAEAIRYAQDKVDEFTTMSFDTNLSIKCGGSLTADVANYNDTVPPYKRRWVVVAGPDGDQNLRQVTIRVIPEINDRRMATPVDLVTVVRGTDFPC